ncbi:MAG TPA: hypothetical protein VLW86_09270 [Syntrophorhabdales bacterium]|nr:hypothetical protein [Syntrophorhabdales bacterium]
MIPKDSVDAGATLPYMTRTSERGVQTEIYLPRKWYFQRFVYDTMINGLNLDHVKKSLVENIQDVNDLMKDFAVRRLSGGLADSRIERMKPAFWGYAVYEVDRVFCASIRTEPAVDAEKVQVIRVMFRTDIEDIHKALEAEGLTTPTERIRIITHDLYRSNSRELESLPEKTEASIIRQYLDDWLWDIRLFLFGYVIREVCQKIKILGENIKPADEIWVVSFWDTRVSRIVSVPYNKGMNAGKSD